MTTTDEILKAMSRGATIYCGKCNQETYPEVRDYGHGRTEFWGSVSNHSDIAVESPCCDSDDLLLEPREEEVAEDEE